MRVYISGAITGTSDYISRFAEAQKKLEEKGHSVINPAAVNSAMPKDTAYEEYMKMAFTMLDMCDRIYMLRGWEKSCGANREYGYAFGQGKKVMFEEGEDGRPGISGQVRELRDLSEGYTAGGHRHVGNKCAEAAGTIESLSAKLAAAEEELERWHTDRINEKIKNPFVWTSTLCCHNCDHKDEYIEELEAQVQELEGHGGS